MHMSSLVKQHDSLQGRLVQLNIEEGLRLGALQWNARYGWGMTLHPANPALAKVTGAIVKQEGRIHLAKVACGLD